MSAEHAGAQRHEFLELVRARWADNATLAERGRDWAAYYAGGVEALALLAEMVDASGGVPR